MAVWKKVMSFDTKSIMFCAMVAIVMFLTGSIVINLYNQCPANIQSGAEFHWWVGLVSLFGGLVSSGVIILLLTYPDRMSKIKSALD